jgi:hypothetical protein
MATLTFEAPTDADEILTFTASTPAGDKYVFTSTMQSKTTILLFDNGHASSITVTIGGVAKTVHGGRGLGSGTFTRASREIVVPAGQMGCIIIEPDDIVGYLDAEDELNIAYTSGNAAMLVSGFQVE